MENYEDVFLKDAKEYVKYIIDYYNKSKDDSFDLLMRFFSTDNSKLGGYPGTELENRDFARYAYELLGWNNKSFDVINSFWTTYVCVLVNFSDLKRCHYSEFWKSVGKSNWNCPIFTRGKTTILAYGTKYGMLDISKECYAKKVIDQENMQYNIAREILKSEDKELLKSFSSLCHCVANFMPCPNIYEKGKLSYNQLKCLLPDVQDYFSLMIDKIERCYAKQIGIAYTVKDEKTKKEIQKEISYDIVVSWHKWFLENRERYCLEDYYDIKDGHLEYKPLFDKQTLEYPVPQKEDEIKDCLEEIIKRIEARAIKMAKKLEQQ